MSSKRSSELYQHSTTRLVSLLTQLHPEIQTDNISTAAAPHTTTAPGPIAESPAVPKAATATAGNLHRPGRHRNHHGHLSLLGRRRHHPMLQHPLIIRHHHQAGSQYLLPTLRQRGATIANGVLRIGMDIIARRYLLMVRIYRRLRMRGVEWCWWLVARKHYGMRWDG